jgi:hypothetical protein
VGLSVDDALARIRSGHAMAGCFSDLATAQNAVAEAIDRRHDDILAWRWGPNRGLPYSFEQNLRRVVGTTLSRDDVLRGITEPTPVTAVRLVLRPSAALRAGFTLVTAFPTRARRSITTRPARRRAHAGAKT